MPEAAGAAIENPLLEVEKSFPTYAVLTLAFCHVVAVASTMLLNILVEPIKTSMEITDTQFSLLQGAAFAILASFLGIPAARIADRGFRRNTILLGVVGWSAGTLACGLAVSYGQLFAARIVVGIGEIFLIPAAVSLLGDLSPRRSMAVAIGIFVSGVPLGAALALMGGGLFATDWTRLVQWSPALQAIEAWRAAFFACAALGAAAATLLAFVSEPPMRPVPRSGGATSGARPLAAFANQNSTALIGVMAGFVAISFAAVAAMSWLPTFYIRVFALTPLQVGQILGASFIVFSVAGAWLSGWGADRLRARGRSDGPILIAIGSAIALTTAVLGIALAPWLPVSIVMLGIALMFQTTPGVMSATALEQLAPPGLTAQVMAIYLLLVNLIAGGLAPTAVAVLTDYVFRRADLVGWSIVLVCVAAMLVALVALLCARAAFVSGVESKESSCAI